MSGGHNDPFHHVRDSDFFELPGFFDGLIGQHIIHLPVLNIFGMQVPLTKFMVLQVIAGMLTLIVFVPLARSIRSGRPAHGVWMNFWEMVALYLRDNVVRPTIGDHHHHDDHGHGDGHGHDGHEAGGHAESSRTSGHPADRFLPFIWTCFFYVLFCNLLGAIPWMGSPTGNIYVTGALALIAFAGTVYYGSQELGWFGFWKNLVPPIEAPGLLKPILIGMLVPIELMGLLIKHVVLAVRLFANMMGGHTVLGVMLGFIATVGVVDTGLWYLVMPASVLVQVGIGLLELLVAFLQAYVFAYLATIFIAAGSHAH